MKSAFGLLVIAVATLAASVHGDEGRVTKFIMLNLKSTDQKLAEAECAKEVKTMVNKFTADVAKDFANLLPKGDSFLELGNRGPGGLRSMFMNALNGGDVDSEQEDKQPQSAPQEEEKKEEEKVETTTEAPKEEAQKEEAGAPQSKAVEAKRVLPPTQIAAALKSFPQSTLTEFKVGEKKALNSVQSAKKQMSSYLDGMQDISPDSKRNAKEVVRTINRILRDIVESNKESETIGSNPYYCRISVNVKSLRDGISDLKKDIQRCADAEEDECSIRNPFVSNDDSADNNPASMFVEVLTKMNERAMVTEEEKLVLQSSLSAKDRTKLVNTGLDDIGIKRALAAKKSSPTLFNQLDMSDLDDMVKVLHSSNDTDGIAETLKLFENKYLQPQKSGTQEKRSDTAEEKVEEFEAQLEKKVCEKFQKENRLQIKYECDSNKGHNQTCFKDKDSREYATKSDGDVTNWVVSNQTVNKCGRPKYFDVTSGINGARVKLEDLMPSAVFSKFKKSDFSDLELKAVKDTCGNDGDKAANVTFQKETEMVFVTIDCTGDACSRYMCNGVGDEVPISEILLAYKVTSNECHVWQVFGRVQVAGTTIKALSHCRSNEDEDDAAAESGRRRRLLSKVGGGRSEGGSC